MKNDDVAAAALERAGAGLLDWLRQEAERPGATPRARLLAIWDVLEAWFLGEDFHASVLAAALVAPVPDGRPAVAVALARHRRAVRQLLEEVATQAGVADPAGLAAQVHLLVEGAVVGALVDRQPQVARHARELTELALASAGAR